MLPHGTQRRHVVIKRQQQRFTDICKHYHVPLQDLARSAYVCEDEDANEVDDCIGAFSRCGADRQASCTHQRPFDPSVTLAC